MILSYLRFCSICVQYNNRACLSNLQLTKNCKRMYKLFWQKILASSPLCLSIKWYKNFKMYITFFVKVLYVDDVSRSHFKCLASNLFRVTDLNSKIPVKSSSYIYIEGVAKDFLHFWSRSKHLFQTTHQYLGILIPEFIIWGDVSTYCKVCGHFRSIYKWVSLIMVYPPII